MVKFITHLFISALSIMLTIQLEAQDKKDLEYSFLDSIANKKNVTFQVNDSITSYRITSVNITGSWYRPELDFFNDVFLPYFQVSDRFGWNYSIGGNVTFTLPKEFRGRLGVSYWKDKVTGTSTSSLKSLEIALTRYKLGLLYAPHRFSAGRFQPYIGIDGQFLMVRNKLVTEPNKPIQKGSDYVYSPFVGIEFVRKHFISSVEYSYNLGDYQQDICDCIGLTRQKVSIDGPEITLSIGYKF